MDPETCGTFGHGSVRPEGKGTEGPGGKICRSCVSVGSFTAPIGVGCGFACERHGAGRGILGCALRWGEGLGDGDGFEPVFGDGGVKIGGDETRVAAWALEDHFLAAGVGRIALPAGVARCGGGDDGVS